VRRGVESATEAAGTNLHAIDDGRGLLIPMVAGLRGSRQNVKTKRDRRGSKDTEVKVRRWQGGRCRTEILAVGGGQEVEGSGTMWGSKGSARCGLGLRPGCCSALEVADTRLGLMAKSRADDADRREIYSVGTTDTACTMMRSRNAAARRGGCEGRVTGLQRDRRKLSPTPQQSQGCQGIQAAVAPSFGWESGLKEWNALSCHVGGI
jgi:hypothetical protein